MHEGRQTLLPHSKSSFESSHGLHFRADVEFERCIPAFECPSDSDCKLKHRSENERKDFLLTSAASGDTENVCMCVLCSNIRS